jgi:hypothetical protein
VSTNSEFLPFAGGAKKILDEIKGYIKREWEMNFKNLEKNNKD